MFLQLLANGLTSGSVYALVALGFGLIYNTTGIIHFAHGIVYTASAYILYHCFINLHLSLFASIALSLTGASLLGILIEIVIYAPLRKKGAAPATYIISSLAVYILIQNLIALIFGNETKILFSGVGKTYQLGSIILTQIQLLEGVIFLFLFILFCLFLTGTKTGIALRGLAGNPNLAVVLGIDVNKARGIAFGLGSFMAGTGAVLISLDVGIDPNMGLDIFLLAIVAVIVGGVKVLSGAALGGLMLGIIQNMVIWQASARWMDLITFFILIFFLLFRPEGILGRSRRVEEA